MRVLTKKEINERIIFVMTPYVISKNSELCNNFPISIIKKDSKETIEFALPHALPGGTISIDELIGKSTDDINQHFTNVERKNQQAIEKRQKNLRTLRQNLL